MPTFNVKNADFRRNSHVFPRTLETSILSSRTTSKIVLMSLCSRFIRNGAAAVKDEPDGPSAEKKMKLEKSDKADDEEVKAMKKQNKQMFNYRDALKALKTTELTKILLHNNQHDASGTERV